MTAAHAVDCHYFEWADFTPLDRWIAVFEERLTPNAPLDAPYDAMRVYSAFLIALLFRAAGASADRRSRRRGRAPGRRRLGARRAAQFPAERRVDPVQLLQLEDEGRHGGCADRARHAVARRPARDAAEPSVVARSPRVQPSDPRPFRRSAQDDGRSRGDRPSSTGCARCCSRSTTQKSRPSSPRATSPGSLAALDKLRTVLNPARRMDVAYFKFQESTVRMLEGRADDAVARRARGGDDRPRAPACRQCRSRISSSARRCRICSAARSTRRSRATTRRSQSPSASTRTTSACSAVSSKRYAARAAEGRIGDAVALLRGAAAVRAASAATRASCASCPS